MKETGQGAERGAGGVKYDPAKHHRRSIRLRGYDYTQTGAYFVTICTHDRQCLFGEIVDGQMVLNDAGRMVETVWNEIPIHYYGVDIDAFQIMPNHIHGIVLLVGAGPCACPHTVKPPRAGMGQPQGVAPTGLSLPDVMHRFKTMTTKRYIDGVKQHKWPRFNGKLWQRNYWEHIVRDEQELFRIRQYIINNPAKWEMDRNYTGPGNRVQEPMTECGHEPWMV